MITREDLESYLIRLGSENEEVEEGMWVLHPREGGANVVVSYSPPVVLLRVKIMELPDAGDTQLAGLFRRLLELNANDLVHGSYGLEEGDLVLSDAMELEALDFVELRSSYESLVMAASSHPAQLAELVPASPAG